MTARSQWNFPLTRNRAILQARCINESGFMITIVDIDMFGDDREERFKVLDAIKVQLPSNEVVGIDRIMTALRGFAYGDIKKIESGDNVLATFILCSCFIEQVATYRYGTANVGHTHFKAFVDEYLKAYDGQKLRSDLRNKLVHNYSLGETYSLTMRNRSAHLKEGLDGKTILNLENFVDDLGQALDVYEQQLITDREIRELAFKILSKNHIIGFGNIDYINFDNPDLVT